MGEVIELGATVREVLKTAAPMRQPGQSGENPVSQWVRVGIVVDRLVGRPPRDNLTQAGG